MSTSRGDTGRQPVRAVAARQLAKVRSGKASLADAIPEGDALLPDSRDRALMRLIVYQTVRTIYRREAALAVLLERPLPPAAHEVEALLLLALTQLDEGIDGDYAVIDASVQAARALGQPKFAGLVNALLRRAQRQGKGLYQELSMTAQVRFDHPQWMIERFSGDWPSRYESILTANNARAPTWLRVNRARGTRSALQATWAQAGIEAIAHDHLPDALMVNEVGDVTALPGWVEGMFSVQDLAAQAAVELLDVRPGMRVLDACAAPGGKLAHIAERHPELALLLGLDRDGRRLERTRKGMLRLGLQPMLKQADAADTDSWWRGALFDRVLIDAPCSGTGVIRRHPDIRLLRRDSDILPLARQQSRLLDALWPLLAPGAKLVYATCSVLKDENQRQIDAFLSRWPDAHAVEPSLPWFGTMAGVGRQNLPGDGDADGFFYAVLCKPR